MIVVVYRKVKYEATSVKQSYSECKTFFLCHIYWVQIETHVWQFQMSDFKCCTCMVHSSSQVGMDAVLVSLLFMISIYI